MLYNFFVCWYLNQDSWLQDQDLGFRNRAIKHSLKTRQLVLGYIGSTKMHKTIGTPPCTLRQPWVSVTRNRNALFTFSFIVNRDWRQSRLPRLARVMMCLVEVCLTWVSWTCQVFGQALMESCALPPTTGCDELIISKITHLHHVFTNFKMFYGKLRKKRLSRNIIG